MTAICTTLIGKQLLICTDILLSTTAIDPRSRTFINVPSIGNSQPLVSNNNKYVASDFALKFVLLDDKTLITFSGSLADCKKAILYLKSVHNAHKITSNSSLEYLLKKHSALNLDRIHLIYHKLHNEGYISIFHFNCNQDKLQSGQQITYAGTGGRHLKDIIDHNDPQFPNIKSGPIQEIHYATYGLLSGLFLEDIISPNTTLKESFGGGYIAIVMSNNKFMVLDDITYIVVQEHKVDDSYMYVPVKITEYQYSAEHLYIRDMILTSEGNETVGNTIAYVLTNQITTQKPSNATMKKLANKIQSKEISLHFSSKRQCLMIYTTDHKVHTYYDNGHDQHHVLFNEIDTDKFEITLKKAIGKMQS